MLKSLIQKFKKLEEEIKLHDSSYHTYDDPKISDANYDKLKQELQNLQDEIGSKNVQTDLFNKVGAAPLSSFSKVKHNKPMLSLANAFNKQDIEDFIAKIEKFLGFNLKTEQQSLFLQKNEPINLFCEPKIDGLSFNASYENGNLVKAATRGDGYIGEDITANISTITDFPRALKITNPPKKLEVRGEVYMSKEDFFELNKKNEKGGAKIFANPRNAAAGSLRQLDSNVTKQRKLSYFAYGIGASSEDFKCSKQSELIEILRLYGFKTEPHSILCKNLPEIIDNYNKISNKRYNIAYDLDGMVYKVDDFSLQARLGFVARSPRWAIAHKFASEKSVTKIKDIIIQVGRTGALTPVAILNPVNIGGVIVSRAALHNKEEIEKKDIRIGDEVIIQRAGEVIPQVLEVKKEKRDIANLKKFEFPKYCPSCQSIVEKVGDDVIIRCLNNFKCPAQQKESLKHFVSKDAFDIEGLGKKQIDNFFTEKRVKNFIDIFELEENEKTSINPLIKKEGWKEKSVNNLFAAINNKRKIDLHRFIYSLGIRYIGQITAKLLSNNYYSWNNFKEIMLNIANIKKEDREIYQPYCDFINIDGVGKKIADTIIEYFEYIENINNLNNLTKELEIIDPDLSNFNSNLAGKKILFTGTLKLLSRAEAKEKCEKLGIKIVNSISNKTDYLVAGQNPGSKIKKAADLGIKIIDEESWLKLIN